MGFFLHDPIIDQGEHLLEAFLSAVKGATGGAGAFAFVSKGGVDLLLSNPTFAQFLAKSVFELVIGTDAVTSPKALNALASLKKAHAKLKISAFLNPKAGIIFHPKFCWFSTGQGGVLLTGSGNLTKGGLRSNWEAYTVTAMSRSELATLEQQWKKWVAANAKNLKAIDDPAVVAKAMKNEAAAKAAKKLLATAGMKAADIIEEETEEDVGPQPALSSDVLIAEIPGGGTRWEQANFDKDSFENYFGAKPGGNKSVVFLNVQPDGSLKSEPPRPSVTVRSHNFRFELAAAKGLTYPKAGRPIGVFVRVSTNKYWYSILMPEDPAHAVVSTYAAKTNPTKPGRMNRFRIPFADLKKVVPALPLVLLAEK